MSAGRGLILAFVLLGLVPGAAGAVVPLAPPENSFTSSTPTFRWSIGAGEKAFAIELSPNPAPGDGGGFADDIAKRVGLLADAQTSFTVGNADPLFPGVWFWHVNSVDPEFDPRWSPTRRVVVRDEPIELRSFKFNLYSCLRKLGVEFSYADNSVAQPARYRIEFRRRKGGRRVGSIAGRADNGRHFRFVGLPRRLKRGKRYYVQLKLRDAGAHVTRSRFRRLRIERC